MKTFELKTTAIDMIRAANIIAPKSDIRDYLNGVLLDCDDVGPYVHIVATDGYRMTVSAAQWADIESNTHETGQWTIPKTVCDWIAKLKTNKTPNARVMLMFDEDHVSAEYLGQSVSSKSHNGKFPDWRRVLPKGDPVPTAQIGWDTEYLVDIAKWRKALSVGALNKSTCGVICTLFDASSVSRFSTDTDNLHCYYLMPMRM